ncbi:Fig2p KNAG_0I02690 [Huiozyma naganishii CBS 8797]|uniref:Flo11 domain-containing protein n=1 Tax=Huiozyma naganishii (strain ATCC MYA-139 / BCRC 22969 / CBS 8797 / KCTC 17520 / NBRC 10181 / NCYC 3082 / Yp74L-3) TaxID=1071383 RepID=J7S9E5_HUIN7|nr:hypothetical protein KNAG_0I02690 [Kazachstania naganishii CBS 8797]CCK72054.1 hypothetical protein KNAG_0I02690 [Kazachstania naganishii CBS 8797]
MLQVLQLVVLLVGVSNVQAAYWQNTTSSAQTVNGASLTSVLPLGESSQEFSSSTVKTWDISSLQGTELGSGFGLSTESSGWISSSGKVSPTTVIGSSIDLLLGSSNAFSVKTSSFSMLSAKESEFQTSLASSTLSSTQIHTSTDAEHSSSALIRTSAQQSVSSGSQTSEMVASTDSTLSRSSSVTLGSASGSVSSAQLGSSNVQSFVSSTPLSESILSSPVSTSQSSVASSGTSSIEAAVNSLSGILVSEVSSAYLASSTQVFELKSSLETDLASLSSSPKVSQSAQFGSEPTHSASSVEPFTATDQSTNQILPGSTTGYLSAAVVSTYSDSKGSFISQGFASESSASNPSSSGISSSGNATTKTFMDALFLSQTSTSKEEMSLETISSIQSIVLSTAFSSIQFTASSADAVPVVSTASVASVASVDSAVSVTSVVSAVSASSISSIPFSTFTTPMPSAKRSLSSLQVPENDVYYETFVSYNTVTISTEVCKEHHCTPTTTTVVTPTTCTIPIGKNSRLESSSAQRSLQPKYTLSTVTTTSNGQTTVYITWCPVSSVSEESTESFLKSTVTTSVRSTATSVSNGVTVVYTTWCPLISTKTVSVESCSDHRCSKTETASKFPSTLRSDTIIRPVSSPKMDTRSDQHSVPPAISIPTKGRSTKSWKSQSVSGTTKTFIVSVESCSGGICTVPSSPVRSLVTPKIEKGSSITILSTTKSHGSQPLYTLSTVTQTTRGVVTIYTTWCPITVPHTTTGHNSETTATTTTLKTLIVSETCPDAHCIRVPTATSTFSTNMKSTAHVTESRVSTNVPGTPILTRKSEASSIRSSPVPPNSISSKATTPVRSVSSDKTNPIPISTQQTYIPPPPYKIISSLATITTTYNGKVTKYTTWCPFTAICTDNRCKTAATPSHLSVPSTTEHTVSNESTTPPHPTFSTTVGSSISTVTTTYNGKVTEYTTWCPYTATCQNDDCTVEKPIKSAFTTSQGPGTYVYTTTTGTHEVTLTTTCTDSHCIIPVTSSVTVPPLSVVTDTTSSTTAITEVCTGSHCSTSSTVSEQQETSPPSTTTPIVTISPSVSTYETTVKFTTLDLVTVTTENEHHELVTITTSTPIYSNVVSTVRVTTNTRVTPSPSVPITTPVKPENTPGNAVSSVSPKTVPGLTTYMGSASTKTLNGILMFLAIVLLV